jgi:hypothetical protein
VKFAIRCCGKESFATKKVADDRLEEILRNPKYTGPKKPKRTYQCDHGYWHMTSTDLRPLWEKPEGWAPKPPPPPLSGTERRQLAKSKAAREAILRDGGCIRCGRSPQVGEALVTVVRGEAKGSAKLPGEIAELRLSNRITVCMKCKEWIKKHPWHSREQGWTLDRHDSPVRNPVLYNGLWVYLDDQGGVYYVEEEKELEKPEIIVVDLDGTLAMRDETDPDCRGPFDWGRVGEDQPVWPVIKLARLLMRDHPVLFVSGRMEQCRRQTLMWLDANVVAADHPMVLGLLMRPDGDQRPDYEIKAEIYERDIEPYYDVAYVIDDRKQVVDMWRERGLTVLDVAGHTF